MRTVLLLAAIALVVPATAQGKAITITCDAGQYQLLHGENPRIANLRAHNLPRRTSGYAPRCLVAEAIAGQAERFDLFNQLTHHPFPGGRWLRTPALVLAMAWYRLRDLL